MSSTEAISPTAHYTGYVWARNGLSHPALATLQGRLLFESLRPAMKISRVLGGATLERYLLARHRAIDALLERAIARDGITQVIEVAAGLSPRGWRFASRYGERIVYIEADLPGMAARKREALEGMGSLDKHHRVAVVDALKDEGPDSLAAVTAGLDAERGLAIITEGLLGYLPNEVVDGIWRRFARVLDGFASGRYLSDVHLANLQTWQIRAFRLLLGAFVRGSVYLHFADAQDAEAAAVAAGFASAAVCRGVDVVAEHGGQLAHGGQVAHGGQLDPRDPGARLAHILEASTT